MVVPTFREAGNLPLLVPRIADALRENGWAAEILIVDDNSQDGSVEAVERLCEQGLPVRILVRTEERGLSSAVIHGFEQARGDYLVCMDADLSHPPERIPALVEKLAAGEADFALGSRYVAGGGMDEEWSFYRRLNSLIATWLARPLVRVKDPMSGFFAIRRETFAQADALSPVGYKIGLELLLKGRCRRPVEVPIQFADRTVGESKLSAEVQLQYLAHLRRLFCYKYGPAGRVLLWGLGAAIRMTIDLAVFNLFWLSLAFPLGRAAGILAVLAWVYFVDCRLAAAEAGRGGSKRLIAPMLRQLPGGLVNWGVSVGLGWAPPSWLRGQIQALTGIIIGGLVNLIAESVLAGKKSA